MEERYPYIRFIIDAAQAIGGAVGVIILVSGTISSCHHGGFAGFMGFLVAIAVAGLGYIGVMVSIESLRVMVDIESALRQREADKRPPSPPSGTAA
jgi:hypothetical protein